MNSAVNALPSTTVIEKIHKSIFVKYFENYFATKRHTLMRFFNHSSLVISAKLLNLMLEISKRCGMKKF